MRRNASVGPRRVVAVTLAGVLMGVSHAPVEAQRKVQHLRGQNVAPVYDGYEANPDGTYSLWFGYLNRNHEEAIDVPIGPDNRFEPGQADRGQPTHFVPQWQKSSFRRDRPEGLRRTEADLATDGEGKDRNRHGQPRSSVDHRSPDDHVGEHRRIEQNTVGHDRAVDSDHRPGSTAAFTVAASDDGLPLRSADEKARGPDGAMAQVPRPGDRPGDVGARQRAAGGREVGDTGELQRARRGTSSRASSTTDRLMAGTYCCWVSREVRIMVK